jgi:predicted RNase H-like HicB family nuclease
MKSYKVTYERDEDGWWVATVQGLRGIHTQGRTIGEARHRIREALALEIGRKAETAELKDDVKLPIDVRRLIWEAIKRRVRAEAEKKKAQESQVEAIRRLKELHLSVRDTSELLGLSHQRIQQLIEKNKEAAA